VLEISIHQWDEVDIHELAKLTHSALATTRQEGLTIERMENWLNELEFEFAPVAIQAHSAGKLVGWLLLFIHDNKRAEINPWALNGHPLVSLRENHKQIAFKLVQQAIDYAKSQGLTRIELSFRRVAGEPAQVYDKRWFRSLGMRLMTETAIMRCVLSEINLENVQIPSYYKVKLLMETDENELYRCYYKTFSTGKDRFFFDQTDAERRAFFTQTFDRSEPLNKETSLILTKDQQIIGFSLVRPTHGEGNCHLWMFGVHPNYRRRGLGKSLLQLIMKKSAQRGFRTMSLACELNNIPAYKLYRGQGFKKQFSKIDYSWKTGRT
jgi:ribosomal protein S18 acetylase RimI-like enzyme